jgi:hypothetical protein
MTLAELSSRSGIRAAYLADIERDREEPSAAALRRVVTQLEPAGASFPELARLLTAPELSVEGEYPNAAPAVAVPSASEHDSAHSILTLDLTPNPVDANLSRETPVVTEALQFDRVIPHSMPPGTPRTELTVNCAACQESIHTEYYDVNGNTVCGRCRATVEAHASTPRGLGAFGLATLFGLGAGLVGAAIYYAVIAIANLEIGIVAVLIGYIVGYAVRKGAGGHGGRRFQVLAVVLTYISIGLAYVPVVVGAMNARQTAQSTATPGGPGRPAEASVRKPAVATPPSAPGFFLGVAILFAFTAALPVLVVFGTLPSGLISAIIIFFGMRQAWKMTAAPMLQILGPFRVGGEPMAASVSV